MPKLGRPRYIPTPKEEAKWIKWVDTCKATKKANSLLRERNQTIYKMRSQGEKWEVIASTFEISTGRAWQIWKSMNKNHPKPHLKTCGYSMGLIDDDCCCPT